MSDKVQPLSFSELSNFSPLHVLQGAGRRVAIAVDQERQQIAVVQPSEYDVSTKILTPKTQRIYPFSQVIGAELIRDGVTVSDTERKNVLGRTIGGALLGGLFGVFGAGVGAIVGSGTSKSVSQGREVTTYVALKVLVEDIEHPVFLIPMFYVSQHLFSSETHLAEHKTMEPSARPQAGVSIEDFWMALFGSIVRSGQRAQQPAVDSPASNQASNKLNDQRATNRPRKTIELVGRSIIGELSKAMRADDADLLDTALEGVSQEELIAKSFVLLYNALILQRGKPPYKVAARLIELGVDIEAKGVIGEKDEQLGLEEEWGTILEMVTLIEDEQAADFLIKQGAKKT